MYVVVECKEAGQELLRRICKRGKIYSTNGLCLVSVCGRFVLDAAALGDNAFGHGKHLAEPYEI